jgi:hypothetical protein
LTYVSATQIKFAPYKGASVQIAGTIYAIPAAGITAANTAVLINGVSGNLAASTTYYVYLANISSTLTVDFSTTGHSTDTTAGNVGIEIKTGDNTRSLIGMIRTNTSSQFFDDNVSNFGVATWFNKRKRILQGANSGTITGIGAGSPTIFFTSLNALNWANEPPMLHLSGIGSDDTANAIFLANVSLDGNAANLLIAPSIRVSNGATGGLFYSIGASLSNDVALLTEGWHTYGLTAWVTAGAGSLNGTVSGDAMI